jgi:hypothetical protein
MNVGPMFLLGCVLLSIAIATQSTVEESALLGFTGSVLIVCAAWKWENDYL